MYCSWCKKSSDRRAMRHAMKTQHAEREWRSRGREAGRLAAVGRERKKKSSGGGVASDEGERRVWEQRRERKAADRACIYFAAHVSSAALKSAIASMSCPPSATSCSADLGGGVCSGAPGAAGVTSGEGAAGSASVSVAMDAPRLIISDS